MKEVVGAIVMRCFAYTGHDLKLWCRWKDLCQTRWER